MVSYRGPSGNNYRDYSNEPEIKVLRAETVGPIIRLVKSAEVVNRTVLVKVTASNTGDEPAHLEINDTVLGGFEVYSGNNRYEIVLQPATNATFEYSLYARYFGYQTVGSATAFYTDLGSNFEVASNAVSVNITEFTEAVFLEEEEEEPISKKISDRVSVFEQKIEIDISPSDLLYPAILFIVIGVVWKLYTRRKEPEEEEPDLVKERGYKLLKVKQPDGSYVIKKVKRSKSK